MIAIDAKAVKEITPNGYASVTVELEPVDWDRFAKSLGGNEPVEVITAIAQQHSFDPIIEACGIKDLLDTIGREECLSHFGIEE